MKPHMSDSEFLLFSRYYKSARRIIEFGSGGSTLFAIANTSASVITIESDVNWLGELRNYQEIVTALRTGRLTLIHVDIGPTKEWGFPLDESFRKNWPDYAAAPWRAHSISGRVAQLFGFFRREADVVFVDGRFRVSCILTAIEKTSPGTVILVHDFWNRLAYHGVLRHLELIDRVDTLAVFRRPNFIDELSLRADKEAAAYLLD